MALVRDHALRRREGLAPNPLVMAQEGSSAGRDPWVPCPVGRCKAKRHITDLTAYDPTAMDRHLATKHPRHPLGREAVQRLPEDWNG